MTKETELEIGFKRYLSESEHIFIDKTLLPKLRIAPNNIWRMYFQNMALLSKKETPFLPNINNERLVLVNE